MNIIQSVSVHPLSQREYIETWHAMSTLTDQRTPETQDEIWLIEHPPVYTLGQAGKEEHILNPGNIPVIHVDRGGQVTYHGPGQLVVYFMIDIRRRGTGVRQLVEQLEQSVIDMLADYGINAVARRDAPGVYVDGAKICSIGLRIRRGCSYHGLALNVATDLKPFLGINPCGYRDLAVTRICDLGGPDSLITASTDLLKHLLKNLGYTSHAFKN